MSETQIEHLQRKPFAYLGSIVLIEADYLGKGDCVYIPMAMFALRLFLLKQTG